MVNENKETSDTEIQYVTDELYGPVYPDLNAAPEKDGILVAIDGSGADRAGYYSYVNGQWSGPQGGTSNMVDVQDDGTVVQANTEQLDFNGFLTADAAQDTERTAAVNLNLPKADDRYFQHIDSGFEGHQTTDPQTDPPLTPRGWSFVSSSSTAINGGWYYSGAPQANGRHSFGVDFFSTTTQDGRELSSGQWAIQRGFAVGNPAGQQSTLRVSAFCDPNIDPSAGFNSGGSHTGETFVGEDDAQIIIEAFDASHANISNRMDAIDRYSETAGHQHAASGGGKLTGDTWVEFDHMATLPSETAYIRVRLQTADASHNWRPLADTAGRGGQNVALRFDDVDIAHTTGLQIYPALGHTHDGRYLKDNEGTVTPQNLNFKVVTENLLTIHANTENAHHQRYTDNEAIDAVEASSPLNVDITGDANTLDGTTEGEFAKLAQNETVTGEWTFNSRIHLDHVDANIVTLNQLRAQPAGSNTIRADAIVVEGVLDVQKGTTVDHLRVDNGLDAYSPIDAHGNNISAEAFQTNANMQLRDKWVGAEYATSINYTNGQWDIKDDAEVKGDLNVTSKLSASDIEAGYFATVADASVRVGYPTGHGFIIGPTTTNSEPVIEPQVGGDGRWDQQLRFDIQNNRWVVEGGFEIGHSLHFATQVPHAEAPADSLYRGPDNELWYAHKGGRSQLS